MKTRLPKEARKNAAISPYDKGMGESPSVGAFYSKVEEQQDPPCVGELLQLTGKGNVLNSSILTKSDSR